MKALFFDAGPVITLVMSGMQNILKPLKTEFKGEFYITPAVHYELIERPITIRRFQFEALQVLKLMREGVFKIYEKVPQQKVQELINLANKTYSVKGKNIDILQKGEVESMASAAQEKNTAVVMDEHTMRLLLEDHKNLRSLLQKRFHKPVQANKETIKQFCNIVKTRPIIRSAELISVAYTKNLLKDYIPKKRNGKKLLIDSMLWATKYHGCAISNKEIEAMSEYLTQNF